MPVSLLTENGRLCLIAGDRKPLNKEFAPLMASRDGMHLINNAEIVQ